jgi:hypothetical protein
MPWPSTKPGGRRTIECAAERFEKEANMMIPRKMLMSRIGVAAAVGAFAILGAGARVSAQAGGATTTESFPLDFTVFIPCVPENVHLTGNLEIVNHTTVRPDGSLLVVSHINPQGLSGVGDATGDTYHGSGVTQNVFNANAGQQITFVNIMRFVGPGRGNDFVVQQNVHVTVNANGQTTTVVDNFSVDCS